MGEQGVDVPNKMPVSFDDPVGEAVHLLGPQLAAFPPAHDVPAGGGPDVDRKE